MRRHWVFDFDGTLVNTEVFFQESMNYALKPFGLKPEEGFLESIRHRHPNELFDHLLPPDEAKEALRRLVKMGRSQMDYVEVFPGIDDVLRSLADLGHRISIWTGRDRASAVSILEKKSLKKYFDQIVTGTCVPNNKPQTDGLQELSKYFAVRFNQLAVVGDHHHDIGPANEMGCFSVHAQWKDTPHILPDRIVADRSFDCAKKFHLWLLDNDQP